MGTGRAGAGLGILLWAKGRHPAIMDVMRGAGLAKEERNVQGQRLALRLNPMGGQIQWAAKYNERPNTMSG